VADAGAALDQRHLPLDQRTVVPVVAEGRGIERYFSQGVALSVRTIAEPVSRVLF
jgi:hypothetical protein